MTCPHFQGFLTDRLQPSSVTGPDRRDTDLAVEFAETDDDGDGP